MEIKLGPADRVARIERRFNLAELKTEVADLLTEIKSLSELPTQPPAIQDLVAKFTDAWNNLDANSIAECYLPDASLIVNSGRPVIGHEGIAELEQGFMSAFPDLKFRMDDSFTLRDRTVNCWTFMGTNTGPDGTGKKVDFNGFEVWTIGKENLITAALEHFDLPTYRSQLGLDGGD